MNGTRPQIAIYASGSGSNAEAIVQHLRTHDPVADIALIVTNNPAASVIARAERLGIPCQLTSPKGDDANHQLALLAQHHIDLIVLAGWLRKVPDAVLAAYPRRIVNIHPALLPKFGGKGMYGARVHAAVLAAGEAQSGITIHYVDGEYDTGDVILQATTPITAGITAAELQQAVHVLEHAHYPKVVADLVRGLMTTGTESAAQPGA